MLPTDNKNRTFDCEPIRNESNSICSDSIDLDSDLQQVDRLPLFLFARRVAKGHRSASEEVSKERQSVGTEIPLPFGRKPFIRSNASA